MSEEQHESATSQVIDELGLPDASQQEELVHKAEILQETPVEDLVVEQKQVEIPITEEPKEESPQESNQELEQTAVEEPKEKILKDEPLAEDLIREASQQAELVHKAEILQETPVEDLVVEQKQVEIPITEEQPKVEESKPPSSVVVEQVLEELGIDQKAVEQQEKLEKKEEILKEVPVEQLKGSEEVDPEDILESVLAETEFSTPKKEVAQSKPQPQVQPKPTTTTTQPTQTQQVQPQEQPKPKPVTTQPPVVEGETGCSSKWYIFAGLGLAAVGVAAVYYNQHSKK